MSRRPRCRECGAHRHTGEPHAQGCYGRRNEFGGGFCPEHGMTVFFTRDASEQWQDMHAACAEVVA